MAVTANQLLSKSDAERGSVLIAAATIIYQATMVFIDAAGHAVRTTGSGLYKFAGLAVAYYDNSAGAAGDVVADVWRKGQFILPGSGFAQSDVGKPAYATDNFTLTPNALASGAVYVGVVSRYYSSTKVMVDINVDQNNTDTNAIETLSQAVVIGDFTDNTNTTGYVDLSTQLPAGAVVLGTKIVTATGFTGDTTAVVQVGVAGDLDRFSAITTGSVVAAGTVGAQPADDSSAFCATATTVRVTVTGAADFTSIVAGAATVYVSYLQM